MKARQQSHPPAGRAWAEGRKANHKTEAEGIGEMKMRALVFLAAMFFSAAAFAQSSPPTATKPPPATKKPAPAHAAPKAPMGCKLVGTVKGTKLWAGDCTDAAELRGAPAAESNLPAAAAGAIPPGQKQ